jgi:hypothetical protein
LGYNNIFQDIWRERLFTSYYRNRALVTQHIIKPEVYALPLKSKCPDDLFEQIEGMDGNVPAVTSPLHNRA